MNDPAVDQLHQLLAAERARPDPGPERTQQVWSQVEARLDGTAPAPPWTPTASKPLWPWLVGVALLATLGGLAALPARAEAVAFAPSDVPTLDAPALERPAIAIAKLNPAVPEEPAAAVTERLRKPTAATPGFAEELALIERGRTALDAGQTGKVLAAMAEHRKVFPKGALKEEAAALRTAATCKRDPAGASEAAGKFRTRYAKSVHADLVRRHCE